MLRGKPPGVAKTLEQRLSGKMLLNTRFVVMFLWSDSRLSGEKDVDPEIEETIDIGFPQPFTGRSSDKRKERMAYVKSQRQNSELEKLARTQTRKLEPQENKVKFS